MKTLFYIMLVFVNAMHLNAQTGKTIIGAGATFPYPLYSKMFSEYNRETGLKVNYQPIGSGGGIQQLIAKTVDFCASDAVLDSKQEVELHGPVVHIPVTAGAVVICYNLPGVGEIVRSGAKDVLKPDAGEPLKLTASVIADIFSGKITHWDDGRIKSLNTGVKIPSIPIQVVHRADGSGTTNIFTTYLSEVSSDWNSSVGKGTVVNWPVGLGGKGNDGVAAVVKETPGAIGYVELSYASQNNITFATVENKAGRYIVPSFESTSAAAHIAVPEDGKISLINTDAKNGYPISGFTWIILYKEQSYDGRDATTATEMLKLVWWMTHEGQQYCADLNYAPLNKTALKVVEKIIKSVTYNGSPIMR